MIKNKKILTSMNKMKLISLAAVIGIVVLFAQQNANASELKDQWTTQYGGDQSDSLNTMIKTNDGGYIAVGVTYGNITQSTSFGKADGWVLKVSSTGEVEWSKQYGGTENDYFSSIVQTSDGGYIIAGNTQGSVYGNTSHGSDDAWILKISADGTVEWTKQYGSSSYETLDSIQIAVDGGYIATGTTQGDMSPNVSHGYFDAFVLKIGSDGSEEWVKQYGTALQDTPTFIQSTSDGGYILSGYTKGIVGGGSSFGTFDGWLLKLSSDGSEQWSKQYGTTGEDILRQVRETTDGGFVATGYFSSTYGSNDGWILKTDSNGVQEWSKWYGNAQYEFLSSIEQTNDGGYVAAGQSYQGSQYDGWLLKVDETGTQQWSKFYGGEKSDSFNTVIPLTDESFVLAGATSNSLNGNTNLGFDDGLIMKLNVVYDLSFDLNGGEGDIPTTQSLEKGMLANEPLNPNKADFAFAGWNTAIDGSGIAWDFTSTTMPSNDVTLYAQWNALYQLQFDVNGGEGSAPITQSLIEGALANVVSNPTRDGYAFKEWNTALDGSGLSWDFNATTMPANDLVLYAQWDVLYALQFDLNGGDSITPATQSLVEGANAQDVALPTKEGYTFVGWNTAIDGTGIDWDFATSTMPNKDVTLYAQWEKNINPIIEYTLSFDLNGGQGMVPLHQKLEEGKNATQPTNPTRSAYTFNGWNEAQDGSGKTWNFETSTMPNKDVTLYAQWTVNQTPSTGDVSNTTLFISLLGLAGITILLVNKRKFSNRNKD